MTSALVGLLGVVLGLAVGFGYRFWAQRRSELAGAVVATSVLIDELRTIIAADRAASEPRCERLQDTWRAHREALITHMAPANFRAMAASIPREAAGGTGPFEANELAQRLTFLADLFWNEHQAFILVPFIRYLKGDTLSKRIHALLDPARPVAPVASTRGP